MLSDTAAAGNPLVNRVAIGVQVENHDIASLCREHLRDSLLVRFEENLKFLTQGRRKKRLQFMVFGENPNPHHERAAPYIALKDATKLLPASLM
jgi:hypothetical protein